MAKAENDTIASMPLWFNTQKHADNKQQWDC